MTALDSPKGDRARLLTPTDVARTSLYRGPGHVGDLTGKLIGGASGANRIQAIGAGTVQFGTTIGHGPGDFAFWRAASTMGCRPRD